MSEQQPLKLKLEDLLKKIEDLKKTGSVDLSTEEDLSIAVMNLISLEEHLFFTGEKTGKDEYFDLAKDVRRNRIDLMAKMIPRHEGETWCVSKHLLSAAMRLIEVGAKLHASGKKDEAKDVFDRAYQMYSMFWGIRLKIINVENVKEAANAEVPWTLKDIASKLVDCCNE